jgi:hypothetical protein
LVEANYNAMQPVSGMDENSPGYVRVQVEKVIREIIHKKEQAAVEAYKKNSEFWCNWVYPEGAKPEDIQNELNDYQMIMEYVSKVYCHITGGLISKPNTDPSSVIGATEEFYSEDESLEETAKDLEIQRLRGVLDEIHGLCTKERIDNKGGECPDALYTQASKFLSIILKSYDDIRAVDPGPVLRLAVMMHETLTFGAVKDWNAVYKLRDALPAKTREMLEQMGGKDV